MDNCPFVDDLSTQLNMTIFRGHVGLLEDKSNMIETWNHHFNLDSVSSVRMLIVSISTVLYSMSINIQTIDQTWQPNITTYSGIHWRIKTVLF